MINDEYQNRLSFDEKHKVFLEPISSESPCGEYLRRHPLMIKLKELRNQILADNEDLGIWVKKSNENTSWENIVSLCEEILTTQSKDLQVCAYYAEAKLYHDGSSGLASALSLMLYLCNEYWDNIYPPLEEDNVELRISSFHWLQINLPTLISRIPLEEEKTMSDNNAISWFWFEQESSIGSNESAQAKTVLINTIEKQSDKFINEIYHNFESILLSLKSIEEEFILEISHLSEGGTSLEDIISQCEKIYSLIKPIYLKRNKVYSDNNTSSMNDANFESMESEYQSENSDIPKQPYSGGDISSCEEAYRLITKANSYLIKNDPHSPSPYLVRRALEWRKKSLYGVLMELFTTTSKPQEIFTLLGLSSADRDNEEYK